MTVTERRSGTIAVLTLARPERLNAVDAGLIADLDSALDRVESSDARGFVLTGEGRVFSSGGDLKERGDMPRRQRSMHELVLRLTSFPKVSVAAVNGLARGGGFELAMCCTLRVAGPGATFGLPEIHRSVMPGWGGTQLLPRLVGREHARALVLTGDPIDAARAFEIGLVSAVADDVVASAVALAERCSAGSFRAQQAALRAIEAGCTLDLAEGLKLEFALAQGLAADPEAIDARERLVARLGSSGARNGA